MRLSFHIRDRQNKKEANKLRKMFERLGLVPASEADCCDVLVVHRNTDAPDKTGGVKQEQVNKVSDAGGIYIEYTAGGGKWEIVKPSHFYGTHLELMERLECLKGSVKVEGLRSVLEKPATKGESTKNILAALSILCQGYIAVHYDPVNKKLDPGYESGEKALEQMRWAEVFSDSAVKNMLVKELLDDSNPNESRKHLYPKVEDPDYWDIFEGIEGDILGLVSKEWGDGDPEGRDKVSKLLSLITGGKTIGPCESSIVAEAFCAITRRFETS